MDRFPGYWRGWASNPQPYNKVVYTIITSDATVLSLAKEGQVDMTSPTRTYATYQTLQSQLGWHFQSLPSLFVFKIAMNTQKPPLNNLLFREAVALAFNYSSLNYVFPGEVPATGPIPSAYKDYNPAVKAITQDLVAAKQALASSGVSPSVRSFNIVYVQGFIPEQQMAEEFQKDLAQIGITVNIQPQTWLTMTQLATNKTTTPDFTVVATAAVYPDVDSLLYPQYATSSQGTWNAFEWFSNATVDKLLNEERVTVNQGQRQQLLYQVEADIAQQYPDVFLFIEPFYLCYSPHVGGVVYYLGAWTFNGLYTMYYKP
jgi:peptide/nickel transport system substrate-binding protein